MDANTRPKYSLLEIERRWLVDMAKIGSLAERPYCEIEDIYVAGTRLRLRKMVRSGSDAVFKLCKKYGRGAGLAEPIANLYVTEDEYLVLRALRGACVTKRRYAIAEGALDLYQGPHRDLAIYEVEFGSEALAAIYQPPGFAEVEITADERFSGASLARQYANADG